MRGRDMLGESKEVKPNHHTCRKLHIWQDELGCWENKQSAPKRRNKNGLTDTAFSFELLRLSFGFSNLGVFHVSLSFRMKACITITGL